MMYLYLFEWQYRNELNNDVESQELNKTRKEKLKWAKNLSKRLKEILEGN